MEGTPQKHEPLSQGDRRTKRVSLCYGGAGAKKLFHQPSFQESSDSPSHFVTLISLYMKKTKESFPEFYYLKEKT